MTEQTTAVTTTAPKYIAEYIPFGAKDMIRLNCEVVRSLVCTPTRSGKLPDDKQCMKFIAMAKAGHLNPFAGDCYLIGYDSQDGPTFSIVTAHQAFLKRAETNSEYNGMKSGVIVQSKFDAEDGEYRRVIRKQGGNIVYEREGDLTFADETLIGGWAEVYFRSREVPTLRRVNLKTFDKGSGQWRNAENKPYMIVKCAEADALRSSFPTLLGGMYTEGESGPIIEINTGPEPIAMPQAIKTEPAPATTEPKKRKPKPVEVTQEPPQSQPAPETVQTAEKPAAAPADVFTEPVEEPSKPTEAITIPTPAQIKEMGAAWPKEDLERLGAFFARCKKEGMSDFEARRDAWIHVGAAVQKKVEAAQKEAAEAGQ